MLCTVLHETVFHKTLPPILQTARQHHNTTTVKIPTTTLERLATRVSGCTGPGEDTDKIRDFACRPVKIPEAAEERALAEERDWPSG